MTVNIPERLLDLLGREKKAIAHLALVKSDGAPQVTPVWFDYDGELIIINTARGRVKDRILHRGAPVALAISYPQDPYRYIQIAGRVVAETEEGGYDEICDLNLKYQGNRNYPVNPGEVRVTYKIRPEKVQPNK